MQVITNKSSIIQGSYNGKGIIVHICDKNGAIRANLQAPEGLRHLSESQALEVLRQIADWASGPWMMSRRKHLLDTMDKMEVLRGQIASLQQTFASTMSEMEGELDDIVGFARQEHNIVTKVRHGKGREK